MAFSDLRPESASLIKLQAISLVYRTDDVKLQVKVKVTYNFIKKRHQDRYFPVNIKTFIITPILKNICEWLHFWKVFCKNIFQIRTSQRELLMKQKWSPDV